MLRSRTFASPSCKLGVSSLCSWFTKSKQEDEEEIIQKMEEDLDKLGELYKITGGRRMTAFSIVAARRASVTDLIA